MADDIAYAFIWDGEHGGNLIPYTVANQRIESLSDVFISQWSHYFHWGGRTIAHVIVQFFAWQGKALFDFLNVLVFCAAVFLIFKIGTGLTLRDMNKKYLLFILFGLYFCTSEFCMTEVWMTGAINYLWMTTLELLFLLPFAMKLHDKNFSCNAPLMAVLGILAGWSIEPGAAVTLLITFLCMIKFWRDKNLQSWQITGFVFLIIGSALLILAPGNIERATLENVTSDSYSVGAFLLRLKTGFLPIFFRELILFLPIIYAVTHGKSNKFIWTFSVGAILILCVMMFSPQFPQRSGFTSTIFLLIASLAAFKEILPDIENIFIRRKIFNVAAIVFLAVWLIHMSACVYVYSDIRAQIDYRMEIVNENRNAEEIVVPALKLPYWSEIVLGQRTYTKFVFRVGDLRPYTNGIRNIMFSRYYGINKIRTDEDSSGGIK